MQHVIYAICHMIQEIGSKEGKIEDEILPDQVP